MKTLQRIPGLLWISLRRFIRDDALNHSAALSYYTVFALPAVLIILISSIGYFWGESAIEQRLFAELSRLVGSEGAGQVRFMLDKVRTDTSHTTTLLGIGMLLFSSTIVFYTLQHSLNKLWKIDEQIRHGFVKYVLDKLLSLAFILAFGILLAVSLITEALISWMNSYFGALAQSGALAIHSGSSLLDEALAWLQQLYNSYFSAGFLALELLVAIALNSLLFAGIFKLLPDARVKWRTALPGGLLTALLFRAGQFLIGWKLGHTDFSNSYGSAGALIIVFVWIYYSSTVVFYGGIFTDLYGKMTGNPIEAIPGKHHESSGAHHS